MTPPTRALRDGPTPRRSLRDLWFAALSFARVYRRLVLLSRPVEGSADAIAAFPLIRISLLAPGEIDAYLAFRPDQGAGEIRDRLSRGYLGFVAWHGKDIVHAAWAATGRAPIDYLERDIDLAPDEVFVFDAFTAPSSRGRNVSPLRALCMGRHYRDLGYRRVLTAVHPENRTGLRPLEKVGARPVGTIGFIGIGPWRWHFRHGSKKREGTDAAPMR